MCGFCWCGIWRGWGGGGDVLFVGEREVDVVEVQCMFASFELGSLAMYRHSWNMEYEEGTCIFDR